MQVRVPAAIAGPNVHGFSTVHAFIVSALSINTGKVYIGIAGLNRITLDNVLIVLPIPTANLIPTFSVSVAGAANALRIADLWIDADVANEGVLISAIVT